MCRGCGWSKEKCWLLLKLVDGYMKVYFVIFFIFIVKFFIIKKVFKSKIIILYNNIIMEVFIVYLNYVHYVWEEKGNIK